MHTPCAVILSFLSYYSNSQFDDPLPFKIMYTKYCTALVYMHMILNSQMIIMVKGHHVHKIYCFGKHACDFKQYYKW